MCFPALSHRLVRIYTRFIDPLVFRVLGPLEVARNGTSAEIRGRQPRALLALLLVSPNRIVPTDRLIDELWGDDLPADAAGALQVAASRVRSAFRGDPACRLVARPPGYVLEVDPDRIDATAFERLADEGRRLLESDAEGASARLRAALELWRGPPLEEFSFAPSVRAEAARLDELRTAIEEERLAVEIALGRHGAVVADLKRLVARHPARERLRELQRAVLRHDPELAPQPARLPTVRNRRGRLLAGGVAAAAVVAGVGVAVWPRASGGAPPSPGVEFVSASGAVTRTVAAPVTDGTAAVRFGRGLVLLDPTTATLTDVNGARRTVAGVGGAPAALAAGFGEIWVGDPAHRQIVPYDPVARVFGKPIALRRDLGVLGEPAARVATGAHSVWVDTGGFGGVVRIDPLEQRVTGGVRNVETGAIATGAGAVWVAGDYFTAPRLDRITPTSVVRVSGRVPLPGGAPVGIAIAGGAVWVATDDGTIDRVDPVAMRVVGRYRLPPGAGAIAAAGGSVWVANAARRSLTSIPDEGGAPRAPLHLAGRPVALVGHGGTVAVLTTPRGAVSPPTTGGGTVRGVLDSGIDSLDPALASYATTWQIEYLTGLPLLGYPDRGGAPGARLVPEGAAAMPHVSRNGRRYTFKLRAGLRFSNGRRVSAADYVREIERVLAPSMASRGAWYSRGLSDVVGTTAYAAGASPRIRGIRTPDARTIVFSLRRAAGDFLSRLAMPYFSPVPAGTPDHPAVALPVAGPYRIASYLPGRWLVLAPNPDYAGPRRLARHRIVIRLGTRTPAWRLVALGAADIDLDPVSPADARRFPSAPAHGPRFYADAAPVLTYVVANMRSGRVLRAPLIRHAVSLALDPRALAATFGRSGATATDRMIPAFWPGDSVAPRRPAVGRAQPGRARALLRQAGLRKPLRLVVSECAEAEAGCLRRGALIRRQLAAAGIRARIIHRPRSRQLAFDTSPHPAFDLADEGFVYPYVDPDMLVFPGGESGAAMPPAHGGLYALRGARRAVAWSRLARRVVASGAVDPYAQPNTLTLVSGRTGCVVSQPVYGVDLARLCIR